MSVLSIRDIDEEGRGSIARTYFPPFLDCETLVIFVIINRFLSSLIIMSVPPSLRQGIEAQIPFLSEPISNTRGTGTVHRHRRNLLVDYLKSYLIDLEFKNKLVHEKEFGKKQQDELKAQLAKDRNDFNTFFVQV